MHYDEVYRYSRGNKRDAWYSAKKVRFNVKPETTRRLAKDIFKQLRGDLFLNGRDPETLAARIIR